VTKRLCLTQTKTFSVAVEILPVRCLVAAGRLFQSRGPATATLLSPTNVHLHTGVCYSDVLSTDVELNFWQR